ncbi:hypothetical protein OUZ56_029983 [Daphnia magna]|uniref:Uncharacterized protein n=1 Tax=Daphnia magna TaxID=35525 RepID=A0ABR0B8G2_9CRUS|nr:hypothetical protein OUZ56_029983 [Daphnia magna]
MTPSGRPLASYLLLITAKRLAAGRRPPGGGVISRSGRLEGPLPDELPLASRMLVLAAMGTKAALANTALLTSASLDQGKRREGVSLQLRPILAESIYRLGRWLRMPTHE